MFMFIGRSRHTNPFARAGCEIRSIFKWSLNGLNSEFSFSLTGCLTKATETKPALLFTCGWKENNWIHTFPWCISEIQNLNSFRNLQIGKYTWKSLAYFKIWTVTVSLQVFKQLVVLLVCFFTGPNLLVCQWEVEASIPASIPVIRGWKQGLPFYRLYHKPGPV